MNDLRPALRNEVLIPRGTPEEGLGLIVSDPEHNRDLIGKVRTAVKAMPQVDVPVTHYFADHLYGRALLVKKGTLTVARIHKQSQLQIMLSGSMSVFSDNGLVNFVGPCVWVAPAGVERATLYNEDTWRITILGTDLTDPQEIFDTYTAETRQDHLLQCKKESP